MQDTKKAGRRPFTPTGVFRLYGKLNRLASDASGGEVLVPDGVVVDAAEEIASSGDRLWAKLWELVLSGRGESAHALRGEILENTEVLIDAVDDLCGIGVEYGCDPDAVRRLDAMVAAMRRKFEYRASRWQTAEDLEYLAAESLAPTAEEFRRVRDSLPFPQAWLDDDSPCPF